MKTKKQKSKNVPNLRFKGFDGEWERKKLGDIGEVITGSTPPTNDESYYGGEYLFVSPADIQKNRYVENTNNTLTLKGFKKGRKIKKESSLFVCIGTTIGKVAQASEDCVTNQQINAIVPLGNNANFVFSLLEFNSNKIKLLSSQQAVPIINKTTFSNVQINIPSLSEQTRISSFLSLIDKRIASQSKIIEQLETLIKGLSEKLFSQKIRFKEFKNEWKLKSLGEMGETFNGLSGKTKEDFGKGIPYIQYKQIFDSSKVQIEKCGLVEIEQNENQNRVKYGDIFFTISSETPGEIGMSSVLLDEVNEMYLNSFCFGYRPISLQNLNPLFASYIFRSSVFRNEIIKLAQGSTRYNMSKVGFMSLTISLPSSEEQITIAQFLLNIDQKIHTEKNILNNYQFKKQYLLQNLFI